MRAARLRSRVSSALLAGTLKATRCAQVRSVSNSVGGAVKKKEEVHRMAEANKAFAHYRF